MGALLVNSCVYLPQTMEGKVLEDLIGRPYSTAPLRWRRGQARLRAGSVVLDTEEEYQATISTDRIAAGHPNVLRDLAALATGVQASGAERRRRLLQFVATHGLLQAGPGQANREVVEGIYSAANALAMLLALHVDLQAADEPTPREGRLRLKENWGQSLAMQAPQAADNPAEHYPLLLTHAVLLPGLNFGVGGLGSGTRLQVRAMGTPADWGQPNLGFDASAPDLLGLAYLQMAYLVTGGVRLRVCRDPACGRVFQVEDDRQQFCEPAHGARLRSRVAQRKIRKGTES